MAMKVGTELHRPGVEQDMRRDDDEQVPTVVPLGTVIPIEGGRAEKAPIGWYWWCDCGSQGQAHSLRHVRGDIGFHRSSRNHGDPRD